MSALRDKFEMYAQQLGYRDFENSNDDADSYRNPHTQGVWNFWRAALQAQQGEAKDAWQADAGALKIACTINKKLGDVLAGQAYLLPDDLKALQRFHECATDFDSGGHDVPKDAMARLREIGVMQSIGFGRHQTTAFGDYVLERAGKEPVKLPLQTLAERNADAAVAAKGN